MPAEILERSATVEDVLREVSKLKSVVSDAVDDGVRSALKAIKQGRHAAEDAIDDARLVVKRNPFQALGIVFAAGMALGGLAMWLGSRRG
jgi:ElaB/YqjD/DUF883 family membrane-anchored ribosome-binding protein